VSVSAAFDKYGDDVSGVRDSGFAEQIPELQSSSANPEPGIPNPAKYGLASIEADLANFVTNFVLGRLTTTLAAYFVLRAILDTASGGHPLPVLTPEARGRILQRRRVSK